MLVRFEDRNKYDFVGAFSASEFTPKMRQELLAREETSFEEDVNLNARFYIFTFEAFNAFIARTPVEQLGWNEEIPWGQWDEEMHNKRLWRKSLDEFTFKEFRMMLDYGLWELRELAGAFTYKQSEHWDAAILSREIIFGKEDD